MRHTSCIMIFLALTVSNVYSSEPTGGVIRDLVFFQESINDTLRFHGWSMGAPTVDNSISYAGTKSLKFSTAGTYAGFQVFWAGNTNQADWWGADTSVFWAQSTSRIKFWIRSSIAQNGISVGAYGYQTYLGSLGSATITARNTWQLVDLPIPANMQGIGMKGFEIGFGNGVASITVNMDEFLVTNVRMFAGAGPPPAANFANIAASQIGYSPAMKKQFTSPVTFTSFTLVRTTDNATVFTGGGPVQTISSNVISNASVYVGEFSSFTTAGRYKIVANGKESLPFNIGTDIFKLPLRAAQRFFYFQRAFTAVESPYAEGPWVHPTDITKAPAGVVKGWHDAGDLTVYMPTMAQALFWLMESWSDFQPTDDNWNIPESGNGVPDLLDETRWGLEWVLSMQNDNAAHTGGFWGTACVGCTNQDQGYGRTTPNTVSQYCKVHAPTVQNTAKAIAVLAYASVLFQPYDPTFAATCLTAAQNGWTWMQANPSATNDGGTGCDAYAQGSDATLLKTNRMWAAAAMLFATGNSTYETAFQSYYAPISWISSYNKSDAFAGRLYLRCTSGANSSTQNTIKQSFLQLADGVRADANAHPFHWATHYYWGSLSNAAHRTGEFSWFAYKADATRTADRDQLLNNVHYMFGRNYRNISYMSGSDVFGATQWRKEGFHHWMKTLQAIPFHFPGAVAGGPNESPSSNDVSYPSNQPPTYGYFGDPRNPRDGLTPTDGRFTDNDSWSTNEIAINWQGAILYNLYAANWIATGGVVGPPDIDPPVISNVQLTGITASGATITWTTNEASSSVVDYGTTASFGNTSTAAGMTTNHSVTLSGLTQNQTYYYRVKSSDASGNTAVSPTPPTTKSFITGLSKSYSPTAVTVTQGVVQSGTFANLAANDGSYFVISSAGSGNQRIADWYGSTVITETPSSISKLSITFDSKYSKQNTTQILYLYNWSTPAWTQMDSRSVGTADVLVTVNQNQPANFISSSGEIRLRVFINESNGRNCSADFMRFTVETAGTSLSKNGGDGGSIQVTPLVFHLAQNYPNPFNPATTLIYDLPDAASVTLRIYDILGREVATLVDRVQQDAGRHQYTFDGSNFASGVYIYRLNAGSISAVKRMVLAK